MGGQAAPLSGPDFAQGFRLSEIKDGSMLLGHAHGEAVLLARRGDEALAVGAFCTHYGAPLAEGVLDGDQVHCPWHHACFSLRTGAPVSPPALNALTVWDTRREGDLVFVTGKREAPSAGRPPQVTERKTFVIVGAGAAGLVAAETLRREGFQGRVVLLGEDPALPYDRPNLSKDYLAGNAPEEWIPLRAPEAYTEQAIEARPSARVAALDPEARRLTLASGESLEYDALLLATGARPLRLPIPGAELPHVHVLRTLSDSRTLVAAASFGAKRAVVIGASFIGLEVAASLRARGLEVDVVGKEKLPLERILGPELGGFVRSLHESRGVRFHLERTPARITPNAVELSDGSAILADLVVMGVGVTPATELAERAGLAVDRGILVDEHLQTARPGIFAAGDVARYPDPITGERIRIEHWVLAQRQGMTAALNMLGRGTRFAGVPFFWSAHYDVTICFTGYARPGSERVVQGSLESRDCAIAYRDGGRITAVATVGRDRQALLAELALAAGRSPDF